MTANWFTSIWNSSDRLSTAITTANTGIAAALLITFVLTAIAIVFTTRRDALLREHDSAREERIANANQVAALASERVAVAEQHAAEANQTAEGFRLDIARANERAAAANEVAEKERLARLQLEARLAPRSLSQVQRDEIANAIRPLGSYSLQIFTYSDVTEVSAIADALARTVNAAGWTVAVAHAQGGIVVTGIVLAVPKGADGTMLRAAKTLVSELNRHGVPISLANVPLEEIPSPGLSFGETNSAAQMRMLIGTK